MAPGENEFDSPNNLGSKLFDHYHCFELCIWCDAASISFGSFSGGFILFLYLGNVSLFSHVGGLCIFFSVYLLCLSVLV